MVMTRALVVAALLAAAQPALAQFTDPEDGAFDASEWLVDRKGFLPVPMLITEPAIGYGAGAALLFVRNSIRESNEQAKEKGGHLTPPDLFGVAFAGTENGTTFGGAGGMFSFADDRWRYRGGVGRAQINLDFYGTDRGLSTGARSIGYSLDGWFSMQQGMVRLGETSTLLALKWIYLDLEARFDPGQALPALPPRSFAARSSGLGFAIEHDKRDNIFTPSRGWIASIDSVFYEPDFGSDTSFQTWRAWTFGYLPVGREFVLGTRLEGRAARGDVPFYQLPYIPLRGLPVLRYQGENAGAAEAELRWNMTSRWALIGFLGTGRAWGESTSFGDAGTIAAKGVGVRYLIARRLGLYMGADLARGPEETSLYIQVGSAWR